MTRLSRSAEADARGFDRALGRRIVFGACLSALLVAGVGGWAASAMLTGAVVASGTVVVTNNVKKVQHPTGGVVGEIKVKNGDYVNAGDVVLKLDDTQARANLGIVKSQLVQLTGRRARLEAERDDAAEIRFPVDFDTSDGDAPTVIAGEIRLFEKRRAAILGQKAQLTARAGQLEQEIIGLTAQLTAKEKEVELMREELARVRHMRSQALVPIPRELSAHRDLTRLEGEAGLLAAQIARAKGSISEIKLQALGLDQTLQSEASKELREIEARVAELNERRTAAEDLLRRIELRAPQAGVVHELLAHTVGGVINPSEAVMIIVPTEDALAIEVRIAPTDVDQLSIGQPASIRFSAFNQQTTPQFSGRISHVAADLTREPATAATYFLARVELAKDEKARVAALNLKPGMPVEVFIETSRRTALSFLLKPIDDQLRRAFTED